MSSDVIQWIMNCAIHPSADLDGTLAPTWVDTCSMVSRKAGTIRGTRGSSKGVRLPKTIVAHPSPGRPQALPAALGNRSRNGPGNVLHFLKTFIQMVMEAGELWLMVSTPATMWI